jgi:hypothetical protein
MNVTQTAGHHQGSRHRQVQGMMQTCRTYACTDKGMKQGSSDSCSVASG